MKNIALKLMLCLAAMPLSLFCLGLTHNDWFFLSIVGWVLYNTFIDRQPEYSGGFLTFGVGPGLVLFGLLWLVTAFRRAPDKA